MQASSDPEPEDIDVPPITGPAAAASFAALLTLVLSACGGDAPASSPADGSASSAPSPSSRSGASPTSLAAISCATDDPTDVGQLTGAWAGSGGGVYYLRQVGDCLWWFGTELRQIEPGLTGQIGFANVASGRVQGPLVQMEWADIPLGDVLGGGGLTLVYDEGNDQLRVTQQRGDWQPFGDRVLTRIEPGETSPATPN